MRPTGRSVGAHEPPMSILLLESLHPDAEALLARSGRAGPRGRAERAAVRLRVGARDPDARSRPHHQGAAAALPQPAGDRARRRRPRQPRFGGRRTTLGIPVVFAPGGNADTVAEHTLALILDLVRGITRRPSLVPSGRWEERGRYQGNEIRGLCLGILGFGNVGRRVARWPQAFGMRVLVAEHRGRDVPAPYSKRRRLEACSERGRRDPAPAAHAGRPAILLGEATSSR
jgi:hypothetical protein